MRNGDPTQLKHLLSGHACELTRLAAQASLIQTLDKQLKAFLPAPLSEHTSIANIRKDTLVIHATSSVWCMRLRYLTAPILEHMRRCDTLKNLQTLRIRVSLPQRSSADAPTPRARISRQTAQLLKRVADSTDDAALRMTLLRISDLATIDAPDTR